MKKLVVVAVACCTASMVAYGAPTASEALPQSVAVEAKAQAHVMEVYGALKANDAEAVKNAKIRIDEYVKTLSKEDRVKFTQAFEKAYGEILATGKIESAVAPNVGDAGDSSVDMTALVADYAIALAQMKAEEAIASGTERAKDAVAVGVEKVKSAAEAGAAMAKEAAAKASVVIDEAAVKAEAMYKEAATAAEAAYKEAAAQAAAAYEAAAAAVANLGF